jgi:hypothetical protein
MATPAHGRQRHVLPTARAQLTLVEHALCPLDRAQSLHEGLRFTTEYQYTDSSRNRKSAAVEIAALDGLSAHDEFYLWGLLSLACAQSDPGPDFSATPYFVLRRLGVITLSKRGGQEFATFRSALERLAAVRYRSDAFWDPVRGEHRAVSFGFLNYSLPLTADSKRAWRFAWDPIFWEFAQAMGGALSFDLALYRDFDPATRRLYLFLKKIFWRKDVTPALDVRDLAVNVLGFSPALEFRILKWKLRRCVEELVRAELVTLPPEAKSVADAFLSRERGSATVQLSRGPAFDRLPASVVSQLDDSPLTEPLRSIGLEDRMIERLMAQHPQRLLQEWADITLAAKERHGGKFFTASPAAYFVDSVKAAAKGNRTPPDWWRELRMQERLCEVEQQDRKWGIPVAEKAPFEAYLRAEAREAFLLLTEQLQRDLRKAGRDERDVIETADHLARMHFRNRFQTEHPEHRSDQPQRLDSLFLK